MKLDFLKAVEKLSACPEVSAKRARKKLTGLEKDYSRIVLEAESMEDIEDIPTKDIEAIMKELHHFCGGRYSFEQALMARVTALKKIKPVARPRLL